jgi:perosamine synthetase
MEKIELITKKNVDKISPELLELENFWTEAGETLWKEENFTMDILGKFSGFSCYLKLDDKLVGYLIGSGDGSFARIHKIIVHPDYRGRGFAEKLWNYFIGSCREKGVRQVLFRVLTDNYSAIRFYEKHGCIFCGMTRGSDNKFRFDVRYVLRAKKEISHSRPYIDSDDLHSVGEVLKSGKIADGRCVSEFEDELKRYIGRKYAICVSSGSNAIFLSLKALGVEGKEIIIPSYCCISIMSAVVNCGCKPVVVDVDDSLNLSFEQTRDAIGPNTGAIIVPYMFGNFSDVENFRSLGVPIIEDCAQSVGGEFFGKKLGSIGDVSVFSFYATKMFAMGRGGAIATDDEKIYLKIRDLLENDNRLSWGENHSMKVDDIHAALGISQIKKLDFFVDKRKNIAERFKSLIQNGATVELFNFNSVYYRFIVGVDNVDNFIENLKKRGVFAARPVFRPIHRYLELDDSEFPKTSNFYERLVSIPIYPSMTEDEVFEICGIISNWKLEDNV